MYHNIQGADVRPGDVYRDGGGHTHRIIRFDPHPGHNGSTARVAVCDDGCEFTLFDDEPLRRDDAGGWVCIDHHWFGLTRLP